MEEECDGHAGNHRILVSVGRNQWRYYSLTKKQLLYWQGLTAVERRFLVRAQERVCFICALKGVIEMRKKFEDLLYSSMMRSLLIKGGGR